MNPNYQPQPDDRNWLDKVNDFCMALIYWFDHSKAGKYFTRGLLIFLILTAIYLISKGCYDYRHGYRPSI